MSEKKCVIKERIDLIKEGRNPHFVAELETGYAVIGDEQYFHGYTLFLCKEDATELHQLKTDYRSKFLEEMSMLSEAVFSWVNPRKLNYELLGNSHPRLHWHLFPRHDDDPLPNSPVWYIPKEERFGIKPGPDESKKLASELYSHLITIEGIHIISSPFNDNM